MKIEEKLVNLLKDNNLHVSCAESCTGGLIISTIINVKGASNVVNQSFVTYAVEAKKNILGVKQELIDIYGVASNEVSKAMVEGLRAKFDDELLISSTGFAGEKENLCYFSIMFKNEIFNYRIKVDGTRNEARQKQVNKILEEAFNLVEKKIESK